MLTVFRKTLCQNTLKKKKEKLLVNL